MIDLYCERLGPGLWGEPLNAVSNVAFVLAAWWVSKNLRAASAPGLSLLAVLIASIGLGSVAFHTLATGWARALDIGLIGLFEFVFAGLYARKVLGWRLDATIVLVLVFAAAIGFTRLFGDVLNGSLPYVPALVMLFGLGWADRRAARPAPKGLLAAGVLFAIAVGVRSTDMLLCEAVPVGTHFLWHVGAATVTAIATRAYAMNAGPVETDAGS